MPKKHVIRCPICERRVEFMSDPVGPFCSNRCKMIDLGKWMGEEYKLSEELRPEHFLQMDEADQA